MNTKKWIGLTLTGVVLAGCGGSGPGVANIAGGTTKKLPAYRLVDLGAYTACVSKAINDNGQALVVGAFSQLTSVVNAQTGAVVQTIPGTGYYYSSINSSGVVAASTGPIGGPYASQTFAPPSYDPATSTASSVTTSSNNAGNRVGQSWSGTAGYYWPDAASSPQTLNPYQGIAAQFVHPTCINEGKEIVGNSQLPNGSGTFSHAMYLESPTAVPFKLAESGADYSQANYISNTGKIYGSIGFNSLGFYHAVVWDTPTSAPRDLGTLSGSSSNAAALGYAANDSGVAVGTDNNSLTPNDAWVYLPGLGLYDLFSVCDSTRAGWTLGGGTAINSNGWIYGYGKVGGVNHVFVAIPK